MPWCSFASSTRNARSFRWKTTMPPPTSWPRPRCVPCLASTNSTKCCASARPAGAERERRAKVIHAEGELQAAEKLQQAAEVLSKTPQAIQLRYLETLTVIAADKNSTIVFPLPMDMITPFLEMAKKK